MKLPVIDLKELKKRKEENFQDRLRFMKRYAEWVKKNSNKTWSKQQKEIIG